MGIASKFNKGNRYTFQAPEDFEFKDLVELYDQNGKDHVYPLKGLFINTKSQFGDAPVAITEQCYVHLPKHTLDTVKLMNSDDEFVEAVNAGKVGFKIYTYVAKAFGDKLCFAPEWIDL